MGREPTFRGSCVGEATAPPRASHFPPLLLLLPTPVWLRPSLGHLPAQNACLHPCPTVQTPGPGRGGLLACLTTVRLSSLMCPALLTQASLTCPLSSPLPPAPSGRDHVAPSSGPGHLHLDVTLSLPGLAVHPGQVPSPPWASVSPWDPGMTPPLGTTSWRVSRVTVSWAQGQPHGACLSSCPLPDSGCFPPSPSIDSLPCVTYGEAGGGRGGSQNRAVP